MSDVTESIRAQVAARVAEEQAGQPEAAPAENLITDEFVIDCARARDKGAGILLTALMRGKLVYVPERRTWLEWQGNFWQEIYDQRADALVERVAEEYARVRAKEIIAQLAAQAEDDADRAKDHKTKAALLKSAIWQLHSPTGVRNCLTCAQGNDDPLLMPDKNLDPDHFLLACSNGVVNMRTGEKRPGHPEDYITRICPHPWLGLNPPAKRFEEMVLQIFGDRPDVAHYFHKLIGYALCGRVSEKILIILLGEDGDSGKTTLMELLYGVTEGYAAPMPVELLLDQGRPESPNAATPAIMALKGQRLTWASEPGENRRFSVERIKLMSGNDSLTGRYAYEKKMMVFQPSHTLFLLTNHKMRASAGDQAFWSRVRLLECPYRFVPDPKPDTNQRLRQDGLKDELLKTEASGVLAWIVRGFMLYEQEGLTPPEKVVQATAAYRREEDLAAEFIEQCLDECSGATIKGHDLYLYFKAWFQENYGKNPPSLTSFGRMVSHHLKKEKGRIVLYQNVIVNDSAFERYGKAVN